MDSRVAVSENSRISILYKVFLIAGIGLTLSACGGSSSSTSGTNPPDSTPGAVEDPASNGFSEELAERGTVQDIWTIQSVSSIESSGERRSWLARIVELYDDPALPTIDLSSGARFRAIAELQPVILNDDSLVRDHISVEAGFLITDDATLLSVIATPDVSAGGLIDQNDSLQINLTRLEAELGPNVPLLVDYYFGVTVPDASNADADVDAGTGIELMQARLADGRFTFQSADDEIGAAPVLLSGNVGVSVAGSRHGRIPAKAAPLICGLLGGGGGGSGPSCGIIGQVSDNLCVATILIDIYQNAQTSANALNANFETNSGGGGPGQCDCPPNSVCSLLFNDPHLRTFDGRAYSPQAVGEFTGIQNTAGGVATELQWRFEAVPGNNNVSFTTMAGLGIGSLRITIDPNREATVHIDGEAKPFDIDSGRIAGDNRFDGSGDVSIIRRRGTIDITTNGWNYGFSFSSRGFAGRKWMKVKVDAPVASPDVVGMMGNINKLRADDLVSRDGLFTVGLNPTIEELYNRFVDTWRITDETSLLDYAPGESTATFSNLSFPIYSAAAAPAGIATALADVDLFDGIQTEQAEAVCRASGIFNQPAFNECVLDFVQTGDVGIVSESQQMFFVEQETKPNIYGEGIGGRDLAWWRTFPGELFPADGNLMGDTDFALVSSRNADGLSQITAFHPGNGDLFWEFTDTLNNCAPVITPDGNVVTQVLASSNAGGETGFSKLVLLSGASGEVIDTWAPEVGALGPCGAGLMVTSTGIVIHTTRSVRRGVRVIDDLITPVWEHEFATDPLAQGSSPSADDPAVMLQDDLFATSQDTVGEERRYFVYRIDGETGQSVARADTGLAALTELYISGESSLVAKGANAVTRERATTGMNTGTADADSLTVSWNREFNEFSADVLTGALGEKIAFGPNGFASWTGRDSDRGLALMSNETGLANWFSEASSFDNNGEIVALPDGGFAISPFGSNNFVEVFRANGDFGWSIPYPSGANFPTGLANLDNRNILVVSSRENGTGEGWVMVAVGLNR